MNDLVTKSLGVTGVEVKDAAQGIVEAVVARVGVTDRDGDLFLKGAFGTQHVRVSAYNHMSWPQRGGLPPVGRGTIEERGDSVIATLRFFLNTQGGRDTYELMKEMGDLQQWSYGWLPGGEKTIAVTPEMKKLGARRAISSVPVEEVSPVFIGASVDTRTVGVKECESCTTSKQEQEPEACSCGEKDEADTKQLQAEIAAEVARFEQIREQAVS